MNENNVQNNLNMNNGVSNGQVNTSISNALNPSVQAVDIMPLNPEEFPIITNYCENLTTKKYVTNPAIAREEEIKKTMLVLLTPDKSALLIGKPGIGKTAIVEGIAYKIQR